MRLVGADFAFEALLSIARQASPSQLLHAKKGTHEDEHDVGVRWSCKGA